MLVEIHTSTFPQRQRPFVGPAISIEALLGISMDCPRNLSSSRPSRMLGVRMMHSYLDDGDTSPPHCGAAACGILLGGELAHNQAGRHSEMGHFATNPKRTRNHVLIEPANIRVLDKFIQLMRSSSSALIQAGTGHISLLPCREFSSRMGLPTPLNATVEVNSRR